MKKFVVILCCGILGFTGCRSLCSAFSSDDVFILEVMHIEAADYEIFLNNGYATNWLGNDRLEEIVQSDEFTVTKSPKYKLRLGQKAVFSDQKPMTFPCAWEDGKPVEHTTRGVGQKIEATICDMGDNGHYASNGMYRLSIAVENTSLLEWIDVPLSSNKWTMYNNITKELLIITNNAASVVNAKDHALTVKQPIFDSRSFSCDEPGMMIFLNGWYTFGITGKPMRVTAIRVSRE